MNQDNNTTEKALALLKRLLDLSDLDCGSAYIRRSYVDAWKAIRDEAGALEAAAPLEHCQWCNGYVGISHADECGPTDARQRV